MNHSILREKSFAFAVKVVLFCQRLKKAYKEFEIGSQLLRSGTAPGALSKEAQYAESRADFRHKLIIGLKEANESDFWLDIIIETIPELKEEALLLKADCKEIIAMLVSSTKTLKNNPTQHF
jgi:four helix bundle protein